VYEYLLEHEVVYDATSARLGVLTVRPEDHVEFALRLGMDAVHCDFFWPPTSRELEDLPPPPSLTDQLSYLERYLRAAQGTRVGVIANFSSFFGSALQATGSLRDAQHLESWLGRLEPLMDTLLENQERVMRVVCDRFSDGLALVMISDTLASHGGPVLPDDLFRKVFQPRMVRLIAPAKEHGKLVLMHSPGRVAGILPVLHGIGFDGIHPLEPQSNDIWEIRKEWTGKLAIIGNIPTTLLARSSREEIEEVVRDYCVRLAPGGGYVLGSAGAISNDVPPANLVAMVRAVHRYGRYGSLGREV
jgi:uroporphyrinogen-III decarboxylase